MSTSTATSSTRRRAWSGSRSSTFSRSTSRCRRSMACETACASRRRAGAHECGVDRRAGTDFPRGLKSDEL
eukprot:3927253-Prymnesium_polylepis.1